VNHATSSWDELNRLWTQVEAYFKSLKVPRDVWINVSADGVSADGVPIDYRLGFAKLRSQWRIVYRRDELDYAIVDSSLNVRIKATQHVETLLAAILQAKNDVTTEVQGACESLEGFLELRGFIPVEKEQSN